MDDVQKSRIKLSHWIDHSREHLKGCEELASILEKHGASEAARSIREGVRHMEDANRAFEKAAAVLPSGETEPCETKAHGEHGHHHGSCHGHSHSHGKGNDR